MKKSKDINASKKLLQALLVVCAISQPAMLWAQQPKGGTAPPAKKASSLYMPDTSTEVFVCLDAAHGANSFAALQDAVKQNSNSAIAHVYRGGAYLRDGDEDQASADFKLALALDPRCAPAHVGLARIYQSESHWAEVFKELQKAAQVGTPEQAIKALWESAFLHRELKQFDVALAQYAIVLKYKNLDQKHKAYALLQRGEIYARLQKVEQALKDFNQANALDPNLASVYLQRAHVFQAQYKLPQAMAEVNKFISSGFIDQHGMQPVATEAYKLRASIYSQMGKTELAKKDDVRANAYQREILDATLFRTK